MARASTMSRAASRDDNASRSSSSDSAWDAAHMPILRQRIAQIESKKSSQHPAFPDAAPVPGRKSDSPGSKRSSFPPVWMMGRNAATPKPHSFRDVAWMPRRWHSVTGSPQLPHFRSAWDRPPPAPRSVSASGTSGATATASTGCPELPIDQDLTRVSQDEWAAKCDEIDAWLTKKWAELDAEDFGPHM